MFDACIVNLQILIWEAVAVFQLNFISNVPIVIENFQLLRKCVLSKQSSYVTFIETFKLNLRAIFNLSLRIVEPLKFSVNILEESGECEIREEDVIVARANVKVPENIDDEFFNLNSVSTSTTSGCLPLKPADVYFDLSTKGYSYGREFRGIKYVDIRGNLYINNM